MPSHDIYGTVRGFCGPTDSGTATKWTPVSNTVINLDDKIS